VTGSKNQLRLGLSTRANGILMANTGRHPKVSVVIPAHNPGPLIVEAVQSVLAQSFEDYEIIVVDDQSTDEFYRQLEPFLSEVQYVRQDHAGSAVARNRGILLSSGEYIAFLDADDLWAQSKLQKQVEFMDQNPEVVLTYADFSKSANQQERGESAIRSRRYWKAGAEFESLLRQNFIHTSSAMVRRDVLAESGVFDPMLINAQDWDLWIRLAEVGRFGFIDEILSHYRVHDNQSVGTLKYSRNLVYSDQVLMARWQNDAGALSLIREKTGRDFFVLGRRERRAGNHSAARRAFWKSARLRVKVFRSLVMVLLCAASALIPGAREDDRGDA
jgi:glycosyltransferase involved in cell wall biosynthesis